MERTQVVCDVCGQDVNEGEFVSMVVPWGYQHASPESFVKTKGMDICTKCLQPELKDLIGFTEETGKEWLCKMKISLA